MKPYTHLGRRVAQLRIGGMGIAKWSQKRLATIIGIETIFITALENGQPVTLEDGLLTRLAEALDTTLLELGRLAEQDEIEAEVQEVDEAQGEKTKEESAPATSIESQLSIPKAFVSYSWDDEPHKAWVRELATKLRTDGVDVTLDQWHTVPGDQLPEFMENSVRKNDYVLIICTPNYKKESDKRTGDVGYQGDIMTGEVRTRRNHRKFIPILRAGEWQNATPSWLGGKCYIDLRGTNYPEPHYQKLVRTLHGQNLEAPPIGVAPEYVRQPLKPPDGLTDIDFFTLKFVCNNSPCKK